MTSGFFIGQQDLDKIIERLEKKIEESAAKVTTQVRERPMKAKEVAKYLNCHVNTVYENWTHLRHVVDGTPYWFKDEIEAYIKKK